MKITNLKISSVRGIPRSWPDLAVNDRGLIIFGPNGVGKSSIVDSFEYVLTQKSTLFPADRLGVSWETASPHVNDGDGHIVLQLREGGTEYEIDTQNNNPSYSASVTAWLEAAAKSNFVLRRHMLLRFISEAPRNRYELLAPFCNLGSFQSFERSLKTWSDNLDAELAAETQAMGAREQRFRQIFKISTSVSPDEKSLHAELNATLAKLQLSSCDTPDDLKNRQKEISDALGGSDRAGRLAALGGLKNEIQRLGRLEDHTPALSALRSSLQELEKEMAERKQDVLVDLLAEGKRAIESAGLTSCPLCEQSIDQTAVLARIEERIKSDEHITALLETVATRRRALMRPLSDLSNAAASVKKSWETQMTDPFPEEYSKANNRIKDMLALVEDKESTSAQFDDAIAQSAALVTSHEKIAEMVGQLINAEGGGERRGFFQDASLQIETLLSEWPVQVLALKSQQILQARKKIVDRVYAHAIEARKSTVQTTFNSVSGTANKFYEAIHPSENIATSKLSVRQVGQGSVNLTTEFYGSEENPLLHFSESHLDTLGLSYFLALRKHESQNDPLFKVLILDDVMHSVDADHRSRVAGVIRDEFSDHQIIITTHDQHFYDALRRILGNGGFNFQAISGWDIMRGPLIGDPSTDLDLVTDASKYTDHRAEDLSAAGGRFFEWLLKQLDERLQILVPARFEKRHDIGNLWPPLCSKLKAHVGFSNAHPTIATDLENSTWVRNACGAHDNETSANVTLAEAREFVTALSALYSASHCDVCGKLINKKTNGDWECECGTLSFKFRPIQTSIVITP